MKKMTLIMAVFFLLSLLLAVLSLGKISERLKLEASKSVEIAVDLTGEKNKTAGSKNFTVFCGQSDRGSINNSEKILYVKTGEKFQTKKGARYCFENNIIPEELLEKDANSLVCLNELVMALNYQKLKRNRILTLHILKKEEALKLSRLDIYKRFIRAAVERNIKVLVAPDIETAEEIKKSLTSRGYEIKTFKSNPVLMRSVLSKYRLLYNKYYALIVSIIYPLFGFFLMRFFKSVFVRFSVLTFVSLLASFIIAGTLSETDFMLKLSMFSGAKVALLLPPLAVFFILAYENKSLFNKKSAGIISVFLLGFIVVAVIARSGNYSMPLLPFEKELREWFENVFVARPRLKEFLTGHPAMLLGLYMYVRTKVSWEKVAAIFLIALGTLGQTSIINTFCHPQADFILSVLRTMYGLLIGITIGGLLILCLKLVRKY
ncbi:MAG: hypothetical protein A2452_02425 [Candidatus Firestonebacteria bacterium RIFOXYC2_FULL_39_67]|nr:MAG: hypothetical protein A2536_01965 [Candidatus Firestonebacteria bacterium RIFOXYD2_FULL_39_29]OGF54127.1 MAG: hypothetical protein A2497_05995 [Candidatus Firestonebacteria bacterium RifOxyC12_full_39_7]OGF55177.1 MAG: hypothetical protein A2452_02425 [Candidatus Firestonebacteria bacterium RIFOXYC2_FULL_39_67]